MIIFLTEFLLRYNHLQASNKAYNAKCYSLYCFHSIDFYIFPNISCVLPNHLYRGCGSQWPRQCAGSAHVRSHRGRQWCVPLSLCGCRCVPRGTDAPWRCAGVRWRPRRARHTSVSCARSSGHCSGCP